MLIFLNVERKNNLQNIKKFNFSNSDQVEVFVSFVLECLMEELREASVFVD